MKDYSNTTNEEFVKDLLQMKLELTYRHSKEIIRGSEILKEFSVAVAPNIDEAKERLNKTTNTNYRLSKAIKALSKAMKHLEAIE